MGIINYIRTALDIHQFSLFNIKCYKQKNAQLALVVMYIIYIILIVHNLRKKKDRIRDLLIFSKKIESGKLSLLRTQCTTSQAPSAAQRTETR